MSERGNLTGGILLSPRRMSTVKIRARSLFRTPQSRIGAEEAGFGVNCGCFPHPSTAPLTPSQVVHRHLVVRACGKLASGCKVICTVFFEGELRKKA